MTTEPSRAPSADVFDRARTMAVAGMLAASAAALIGSLLHWVTVTRQPGRGPAEELARARSVSGIDAQDGWWVILLAVVVANAALILWVRRKSMWAWIGFFAALVMGSIGIADYRAISDPTSGFLRELDIVGEIDRGIGILLVVAAALLAAIFSLIGVAATPYRRSG